MRHGGSVIAPDRVLAIHYARELYGRRQESVRLWIVRRADIAVLDDPDLLQPPLDRSFKKPGGYVMRDKLAAARELSGQAKPHARSKPEKASGGDRGAEGMTAATELVPATRDALALLVLSMADDEFVLGFSDSEWTGIAPLLEEDVAMSSLAQDELGHAQALYRLLADLLDDGRDADAIAYDRPPDGYYHARLLDHARGDWAMCIARRYLYDTADAVRLEALADASFEPLRDLVGKIRREERYHVLHAEAWLERLAGGDAESRGRLVAALERLGADAWTVLSPLPNDLALVMAGIARRRARGARRAVAVDRRAAALAPGPAAAGAGGRPGLGSVRAWRRVPLAPRRVHLGPPPRRGGRVVTAAIRPPAPPARPRASLDAASVLAALHDVPDPEIPVISVVDLGVIGEVEVGARRIRGGAAADVRRLSGPRPDARRDRCPPGCPRPGPDDRRGGRLRPAVDVRPDHARRSPEPRRERVRPAPCRRGRAPRPPGRPGRVPLVRLEADGPRERLRADRVPVHPLLHGLPAAVRAVQTGLSHDPTPTREPGRVGVVGAGTMGAGIAQVALEAGDTVVLYDVSPGAVDQARARIADGLRRRASKLDLDDGGAEAWVSRHLGRLEPVDTLEAVAADADIVIEAAVEDLALKRVVFATLDVRAPEHTILATNTSALPVAEIAAQASRRSRIVGLHFFNPAPVMSLVEVVVGRETDPSTAARAEAVVTRWGKTPIRCSDSPGFVVNRINRPFTLEPLRLLEGGTATIEEIDGAMRGDGFPQGPFEHIDLIGLDVNLATSTAVHAASAPLRDSRRQRCRRGWWPRGAWAASAAWASTQYDATGHRVRPGPGFGRRGGKHVPLPPSAIATRIRLALANEAYWALGDGVASADRIDLALRLGAAHPQGPIEWARARGVDQVIDELLALQASDGESFVPAPALLEAAAGRGPAS